MNIPENETSQEQALRLAQLEIQMLREQLLQAIDHAAATRGEPKRRQRG